MRGLHRGGADDTDPSASCLFRVNINPVEPRQVGIQGGAFGEHQIVAVLHDGVRTPVDHSSFQVLLALGTGATLEIEQRRFVNRPSHEFPWNRCACSTGHARRRTAHGFLPLAVRAMLVTLSTVALATTAEAQTGERCGFR